MNKKLTLLILLACVACVGTLMFAFSAQNEELRLKKTHSFQASKNHEWGIDGYTSNDSDCQAKCGVAKGMSCGKYIQNCCQASACKEETSGYFVKTTSLVCKSRIPCIYIYNPSSLLQPIIMRQTKQFIYI